MIVRTKLLFFILLVSLFSAISLFFLIIINSPYYSGFEKELNYLSPDLSENRSIIREYININKNSVVKIVFEKKYNQITYDREQFRFFIKDLEIQIWNDSEFYFFNNSNIETPDLSSDLFEIDAGTLHGGGRYNIYIKSDFGVNAAYNIGVGVGRESRFPRIGKNIRRFY